MDWALGHAAVHGRFADGDLASIVAHRPRRRAGQAHQAGEAHSLQPGTSRVGGVRAMNDLVRLHHLKDPDMPARVADAFGQPMGAIYATDLDDWAWLLEQLDGWLTNAPAADTATTTPPSWPTVRARGGPKLS